MGLWQLCRAGRPGCHREPKRMRSRRRRQRWRSTRPVRSPQHRSDYRDKRFVVAGLPGRGDALNWTPADVGQRHADGLVGPATTRRHLLQSPRIGSRAVRRPARFWRCPVKLARSRLQPAGPPHSPAVPPFAPSPPSRRGEQAESQHATAASQNWQITALPQGRRVLGRRAALPGRQVSHRGIVRSHGPWQASGALQGCRLSDCRTRCLSVLFSGLTVAQWCSRIKARAPQSYVDLLAGHDRLAHLRARPAAAWPSRR